MRTVAAVLLTLATCLVNAEVSAIYGEFGPKGTASNSRPALSWTVTPTGGKVTRVEMSVNNAPVPARFNELTSAVEFVPDADMAPGLYCVDCRATIADRVVVRQDWSFEIPSPAGERVAPTTVLNEINRLRADLHLPPFSLNSAMCQAADAHTTYQSLNGITGHFEEQGKPGFIGAAPWDRVQRFGYDGTCFEVASGGISDPVKALSRLFDAPYHRIAFLQPGSAKIGVGFDGRSLTVDCGVSGVEDAGMSPAPGQTGIPVAWDGVETPSPTRLHPGAKAVGYPIVFSWFTRRLDDVAITTMELRDEKGERVAAYLNTPANDAELRFAGVLIPAEQLRPNHRYSVEVTGRTASGKEIRRQWQFTTAGEGS